MPRKQLKPPIKLRRKFAPLIALCREKILTAVPQTSGTGSGDAPITIVLKFAVEQGRIVYPVDTFPQGLTLSKGDGEAVVKYDIKKLMSWFKANHYTNYDASDLFAQRLPIMMVLAKMELKLDRLVEFEQQELTKDIDSDV